MNDLVNRFAKINGIIAGVCDNRRLKVFDEKELENTPFVTKEIERRLSPWYMFPWTKSIIVIGVGYKKICSYPKYTGLRGMISQSAAGLDYHTKVAGKLEELANILLDYNKSNNSEFNYKIFVDTGDLVERSLAVSAGLGYIGKNRAVISHEFGSYFNIGYMLTNLNLKTNTQIIKACPEGCDLCIAACPGKALSAGEINSPGKFDYRKCVSYLTQKKTALTAVEMSSMGNWIYGCDVCQEVCPENQGVKADIFDDVDSLYPDLDRLIGMSDDDFKERFGLTAVFWRGKKTIVRNAEISKNNLS